MKQLKCDLFKYVLYFRTQGYYKKIEKKKLTSKHNLSLVSENVENYKILIEFVHSRQIHLECVLCQFDLILALDLAHKSLKNYLLTNRCAYGIV